MCRSAFLLLATCSMPLLAAGERLQFDRLDLEDGLSQSHVVCMMQDRHGFIWLGTEDGLNRYDGYEFIHFKHAPEDPDSISSGWIWSVAEDGQGRIWAGARNAGLNLWQPSEDRWIRYRHDPEDPQSLSHDDVRAIVPEASGKLWIGTSGGLNLFDPETGKSVRYLHVPDDPDSLSNDEILSLLVSRQGHVWIGTWHGGLNRLDPVTGRIESFRADPENPQALADDQIRSLDEDSDGTIWVGTFGGLHSLDPVSGAFARYQHRDGDPHTLADDQIRSVDIDSRGNLWVGTHTGLSVRWTGAQSFVNLEDDPSDPRSLEGKNVRSIFEDRGGVMWFGTNQVGLSRWNPQTGVFSSYGIAPEGQDGLSDPFVLAFAQDDARRIWVGSMGGLNVFDRRTGEWQRYTSRASDPRSLSRDMVTALLYDRNGDLWIGTYGGGLNRKRAGEDGFERFPHGDRPGALSSESVMSLYEDEQGTLWIGTFQGGLNRYEPNSGTFVSYRSVEDDPHTLSSDRVTTMLSAGPGKLWVGTDQGGLNLFDKSTGRVIRYRYDPEDPNSLSHDTVTSIVEDKRGVLWIGTQLGLNRWNPRDRSNGRPIFKRYTESDGLSNNFVYGILLDETGRLWMSTNKGLSRFDPIEENFTKYDTSHGLQGLEFNFGAYYQNAQGEMFFGGTQGFNVFDPADIGLNRHRPPVVLTSFKKLNIEAELPQPVWETRSVDLTWLDRAVSFEFAALDYAQPELNSYAYKLDNFDDDWISIGQDRRATYTNLDPGNYVFRVKAANNDGFWNEEGLALEVKVVPPPWKTRTAYSLYVLSLGSIILLTYRGVTNRFKRDAEYQHKLELEVAARTKELQEAALSDPLTGLRNRRFLMEQLSDELETLRQSYESKHAEVLGRRSSDREHDVLFLMIDLDGLKTINDVHGHAAGDMAILQMRDVLMGACRQDDTLIRWGGDEFLVVSRNVTERAAKVMAERIRQAVTSHRVTLEDGTELALSCSIGFAFFPFLPVDPSLVKPDQVVTIADRALYIAKESGRNAWVGLLATAMASRERVMETVGDSIAPLLTANQIEIASSMAIDELVLDR